MISWIIIGVLVILIMFFVRISHFKHRIFVIILILLVLFFYTTLSIVGSKNQLNFNTSEDFFNSLRVYGGWLANGFQNLKALAGNAVKMDWASTNGTFSNNKTKTIQK